MSQNYIPPPSQRQNQNSSYPSQYVVEMPPVQQQGYPGLQNNVNSSAYDQQQPGNQKFRINAKDDEIQQADYKAGFLRKVYGIIFSMLLISTLVATPAVTSQGYKQWLQDNSLMLILWFFLFFICFIGLYCTHQNVPLNYIFAFGIAFTMGMYVSHFVALFDPAVVITALLLTVGMTLAITCHALMTKKPNQGILAMILVIFFSALFMMIIMLLFAPFSGLITMYCTIYVMLYGVYLWIDTWLIANQGVHDTDSYMLAALFVYIDIIMIFLYILIALGSKKD